MEILIVTGPPYSGKGTQCEILKQLLGYTHISTGDRCRHEKESKTEVGKVMSAYEEKGELVPDEIMQELFAKILDENTHEKGIILDGYPRTKTQVDDFLNLIKAKGLNIKAVLNIEVPKKELINRAKKRAETSNREDDKDPETHLKRIDIFETSTRPAIDYMKSRLQVVTFDGMGSINDITGRIKTFLEK